MKYTSAVSISQLHFLPQSSCHAMQLTVLIVELSCPRIGLEVEAEPQRQTEGDEVKTISSDRCKQFWRILKNSILHIYLQASRYFAVCIKHKQLFSCSSYMYAHICFWNIMQYNFYFIQEPNFTLWYSFCNCVLNKSSLVLDICVHNCIHMLLKTM